MTHYYSLFDTNRSALAGMFQPTSMMSFEGQQFQVSLSQDFRSSSVMWVCKANRRCTWG